MERNLYVKIAYWYYVKGLTQDEIAKRLNYTRQKVNFIINSLVDLNVVSINIHGYERANIDLETKIEDKYGLKEAILVGDDDGDSDVYKVAIAGAQYLDEVIQQKDVIGVSWGMTLSKVVNQMTYQRKDKCTVVQLMGAQNMEHLSEKADEIARELANRLDCTSYMLYAPVVVQHEETKKTLMQEKCIRISYDMMKKCNIAVLGVGELAEDSTMCTRGYITKEDLRLVNKEGFVGDIAMNLIRKDGSWNNCPLSNRIIGCDMDRLKQINNVIVIASGLKKAVAIKAALLTGCVNTLITDKETGAKLLEE